MAIALLSSSHAAPVNATRSWGPQTELIHVQGVLPTACRYLGFRGKPAGRLALFSPPLSLVLGCYIYSMITVGLCGFLEDANKATLRPISIQKGPLPRLEGQFPWEGLATCFQSAFGLSYLPTFEPYERASQLPLLYLCCAHPSFHFSGLPLVFWPAAVTGTGRRRFS